MESNEQNKIETDSEIRRTDWWLTEGKEVGGLSVKGEETVNKKGHTLDLTSSGEACVVTLQTQRPKVPYFAVYNAHPCFCVYYTQDYAHYYAHGM